MPQKGSPQGSGQEQDWNGAGARGKNKNRQRKQEIGYNAPWRWELSVYGLNKCSLKVHVYLKPQDVTLFGNSAFVDVIS